MWRLPALSIPWKLRSSSLFALLATSVAVLIDLTVTADVRYVNSNPYSHRGVGVLFADGLHEIMFAYLGDVSELILTYDSQTLGTMSVSSDEFLSKGVNLPSTLNLYAVYLLSKTKNIHSQPSGPISLPSNIPYTNTPQAAVPEFNWTEVILLIALLSVIGFTCQKIGQENRTTSNTMQEYSRMSRRYHRALVLTSVPPQL